MERGRSREESKDENFKVGVRVRPSLHSESAGTRCVHLEHGGVTVFRGNVGSDVRGKPPGALIDVNDLASLHQTSPHPTDSRHQTYFYDNIFDTTAQQEEVYSICAQPIVLSVLEGYNGSVIAYGQTGTGKTHTIEGTEAEGGKGIVPRCCEEIFSFIRNGAGSNSKFLVRVSFLEIYNEGLFDLLDPSRDKLRMREDGSGCTFVEGLSEQVVKDTAEVNKLLKKGSTARTTDASRVNKESSRSHAVFTIIVERSEGGSSRSRVTIGKLRLVDLAGSERFDVEAKDKHLTETKNINTSLSTFGKVVLALTTPGTYSYVPYRDSKLTRILKDSLGGNSKTFLICTVSPMSNCFQETLSSLKFAKRAKTIENRAVINQDFTKKAMISAYEKEIVRLQRELIESREGWVSAGELERVQEEKQRAESEKEDVIHQLQRHKEQASLAERDREDYERKIMKLEEILLQGGSSREGGRDNPARRTPISQSQSEAERDLANRRQQLEAERKKLLNEQQMFRQEKDSFQRGRTAPDEQTVSDEEENDGSLPHYAITRRGNSIGSSIASFRAGQAPVTVRQPLWSQGHPSLFSPAGPRMFQGWVGQPQNRSSTSSSYDDSYKRALHTYALALAHPKTGIPCRQFDNGLAVFSGSHAVKWFMENMEGVSSVSHATEVGQKLLNLQVYSSMDGTPLFLSADTSYYRFAPEFAAVQHKLSHQGQLADLRSLSPPGAIRSASGLSARSQRSRSFSPEFRTFSPDSVSVNTYSLLSDTSSVSSYSSTSSMSRPPLVERVGWSVHAPSLLHLTASQGNRSLLKKLLAKQNVDEREGGGRSPLMYAVLGDQSKCAEILIKGGACVNLVDETGSSALCYAAQFGRDQVVRLLLKSGANSALKNKGGKNAMHIAAELEDSLRCLEFLCRHPSSSLAVNERDARMQSPLHISVFASLPTHTRILLMSRSKLSVTDAEGRSPLHYAVTANSLSCIQVIIEACGKEINIPDTSGWSPLHLACHDGTMECVQLLIASTHCDVNLQDLHAATPLHICVFANRPELIKRLIDAGGAVRSHDRTKRAPLHYAIERGYTECAHVLQKHNNSAKSKSLLLNLKLDS